MRRAVVFAFVLFAGAALAGDAAKDLRYSVRAKWRGRYGKKPVLRVQLTVTNAGSVPVTLEFRNSGRVCGELYDSRDKRYHEFPQALAQVLGTEAFPPGKKRLFEVEINRRDLMGAPVGRNAVSAWLCGYDTERAWAEFPMDPLPKD
jgi:hypothetical protein